MSFIQIPNLAPAIALNGTEQLEAVQAGASCRITVAQIANFTTAGSGLATTVGAVAASVSTQGTAQKLSALYNVVVTATTAQGVILPTGISTITVLNRSGALVYVYPWVGAQIESIGVNNPVALMAGSSNTFIVTGGTQCYIQ